MNVEMSAAALEELTTSFRYNDAVLRNMIIRCDKAITEESPIMKGERESKERRDRREESAPARDDRSRDNAAGDDSSSDEDSTESESAE